MPWLAQARPSGSANRRTRWQWDGRCTLHCCASQAHRECDCELHDGVCLASFDLPSSLLQLHLPITSLLVPAIAMCRRPLGGVGLLPLGRAANHMGLRVARRGSRLLPRPLFRGSRPVAPRGGCPWGPQLWVWVSWVLPRRRGGYCRAADQWWVGLLSHKCFFPLPPPPS